MTIKQILGSNKYRILVLLSILLISCSPKYIKYTQQHNHTVKNDELQIKLGLAGDIQEIKDVAPTLKKLKHSFHGIKSKDLVYVGETNIEPYYYICLFKDSCVIKAKNTNKLNYSIRNKKVNDTDYCILLLAKQKMRTDLEDDANQSIEKLVNLNENPYGLIDFFNDYSSNDNILYFKNQLANSNIKFDPEKSFNDFQFLITYYSIAPDSEEYKALKNFYQTKRKQIPDSLIEIKRIPEENLLEISKDRQIVMLNENHWLPEDRILALKFLKVLKQNGFNILAVEALDHKKEESLNTRKFPLTTDGFYLRDPFFGLFIREALHLDFKIVAYDYFDEDSKREEMQAKNLNTILMENPKNKLFVYAGFDHIFEKNTSKTRMAQIFKNQFGIDPITIDQNQYYSNKIKSFELYQSNALDTLNRVDYYVINNLEPTLENVFDELVSYTYKNQKLNDYTGQELFYSIYYSNEYQTYKTSCIPILNNTIEISGETINFKLPKNNYTIRIENKDGEVVLVDSFVVE